MTDPAVSVDHRRDMGVFLARVIRLDAAALVRVRPAGPARLTLWAQLPFDVLAARSVAGSWPDDVTVAAADLLETVSGAATLVLPRRRDTDWRGSLPPERGWQPLDSVPADVVRDLITAGQQAFRTIGSRAAGESLLDHETLRVRGDTAGAPEIAVPFRLLLGLARMAFLGDGPVAVAVSGPWLRLAATHGVVYRRRSTALLV
ncbi:hypothetical protein [Cryptosporangium aurantiacum]|uniref:Uncharacterized protein n=1 Tax=Cryptosporangium aurantiacum TaxID=134849 RepID=A0A1M7Q8U4_9ACTN|nr:hypothetical protein [Cryptosporangium aurantiacum]SHN26970.1 hypothetical protein SAMN05443668_104320 [Cryptosporangium aurantiacum]